MDEEEGHIIDRLYDFVARRDVRQRFRVFYHEQREVLATLRDAGEEQPHEAHDAYRKWERLLEDDISEFLGAEGLEPHAFYEMCQQAQRDDDGSAAALDTLALVLSALDFASFVSIATAAVREQRQAEADADAMGL